MPRDFIVLEAMQRSPEWFDARLGRLGGSQAAEMLATIKGGAPGAERKNLLVQLLCERLTGQPQENGYVSQDMANGIEREADAFAAYEALTGTVASQVGYCRHNEHMAGVSPDGVMGDFEGVLELKAPRAVTHWSYLRGPVEVPMRYRPQLLHSLWITGAAYADFLSWQPAFPAHLRTFYVRLYRNDTEVEAYAAKALAFLAEVEREYQAALSWHAVEIAHV